MANLKKLHIAITSILDDSIEETDIKEETQKTLEQPYKQEYPLPSLGTSMLIY